MKGDSHWIVIVVVCALILLALVASSWVSLNAQGKLDQIMDEASIKGVCDHLDCGAAACCKEGGSQQSGLMQCIRNSTHTFRDSCTDSMGVGSGSSYVKEYFCQDDGKIFFNVIYCGTGMCSDGACHGECTDTDGGINYAVAGYAHDNKGNEGYDACDLMTNELTEYYCDNEGTAVMVKYACPGNCIIDVCA